MASPKPEPVSYATAADLAGLVLRVDGLEATILPRIEVLEASVESVVGKGGKLDDVSRKHNNLAKKFNSLDNLIKEDLNLPTAFPALYDNVKDHEARIQNNTHHITEIYADVGEMDIAIKANEDGLRNLKGYINTFSNSYKSTAIGMVSAATALTQDLFPEMMYDPVDLEPMQPIDPRHTDNTLP